MSYANALLFASALPDYSSDEGKDKGWDKSLDANEVNNINLNTAEPYEYV